MSRPPRPVYTYVIARSATIVKIGRSDNPLKRLAALQVSSHDRLYLVASVAGDIEQQMHRAFADRRLQGEWFNVCPAEVLAHPCWQPSGVVLGTTSGTMADQGAIGEICEAVWRLRGSSPFYVSKQTVREPGILDDEALGVVRRACLKIFPGANLQRQKRLLPRVIRRFIDWPIPVGGELSLEIERAGDHGRYGQPYRLVPSPQT
jgi:hypothetical protein